MPANLTYAGAKQVVDEIIASKWIDKATRAVIIEGTFANPSSDYMCNAIIFWNLNNPDTMCTNFRLRLF